MPEIFESDIPVKPVEASESEMETVVDLFKYVSPEQNPWRAEYMENILKRCYNFKELIQWTDIDRSALQVYGVPDIPVDRINRGLDTIKGIRAGRNNTTSIAPTESGDERMAELLNRVKTQVEKDGSFKPVRDEAFEAMLDCGIGVRKLGYDTTKGDIWAEYVPTEDLWYSKHKNKDLTDCNWIAQRQVMDWEEAVRKFPKYAGQIRSLKINLVSEWEKLKSERSGGVTSVNSDYGGRTGGEGVYEYPHSVEVWEFWKRRVIPINVVAFKQNLNLPVGDGLFQQVAIPQTRLEPGAYEPQEGETIQDTQTQDEWWQFVVVGGEKSGIVVSGGKSKYNWHPYHGTCAEVKKSGASRGYIELTIPHQIRINLAWAQKEAHNNKSIKTPIVVKNVVDVAKLFYQSTIGAILSLKGSEEIVQMNPASNVDLQAIEEGNLARSDMDFAAAATEPALRGQSSPGDSAVKLAGQQSAALLPQNKWVEADSQSEAVFSKHVLEIILAEFPPQKMARIVGIKNFFRLIGPKIDPVTQQVTEPPLTFPLPLDAARYDITVTDESLSDLNKQQSFNSALALHTSGFIMDADYMIMHAPIKDPQGALESHYRARNDIIRQLVAQVQGLESENASLTKQIPTEGAKKKPGNQAGNAARGRAEPQSGRQSMIGGTSPKSPIGQAA